MEMVKLVTNALHAIAAPHSPNAKTEEKTTGNDLRNTSIFLGGVAVVGLLALLIWAQGWSAFAFRLLIMGGAGLVGGVFGLLFGIPKSVSDPASVPQAPARSPNSSSEKNATADSEIDDGRRSGYTVNTNLEQISDWLTKIIVGVSLTQIPTIREQFHQMATYFGDGFISATQPTVGPAAPVAAAAIIVYGLTGGFLAGYLFTRIFLPGAFERVDQELRNRNRELKTKISEVRESTEAAGRTQGEIYSDLYRYTEKGFQDAIVKIEKLLASPENQRNPALWVYFAAAHGQAYRWANENLPAAEKEQALRYHRDQALYAIQTALRLGNDWKPVLQMMWNKQHPIKAGGGRGKEEDDLEVFYDDIAFKELLG
jgi:hypothetical protein